MRSRVIQTNNTKGLYYTYANRCLYVMHGLICVCILRPCNHGDGPIQPLHKQQLCGRSDLGSFLCPHPVWICFLPLQAQVGYILNL